MAEEAKELQIFFLISINGSDFGFDYMNCDLLYQLLFKRKLP
jgi:hypothetical protein